MPTSRTVVKKVLAVETEEVRAPLSVVRLAKTSRLNPTLTAGRWSDCASVHRHDAAEECDTIPHARSFLHPAGKGTAQIYIQECTKYSVI